MEYSKIIAVTGLPGLQELVSSKNDGAIVKSLEDKNTRFVSSRIHNFSHLESIEVYTVRENVNLAELFLAMDKSGVSLPDEKDAKAVKSYFEKVYPDLDFERVYNSDMKKMVKWFSILKANNIEIKVPELVEEEEVEEAPVVVAEEPKAKKTTKKKEEAAPVVEEAPAAKKKAAQKAKKEDAPAAEAEAPKKKAAPKKK